MRKTNTLTKHNPGSMKELVVIALPLLVISFSENIMLFFDRIILSHYSITSLNATTIASLLIEILQYALWAITCSCELIVAKQYAHHTTKNMASPCWQMIYLSLFTLPVIIGLSHYSGPWVIPAMYQREGLAYYQILMYSVPMIGVITALTGFFVGQGKLKLVLISSVSINLVNLCLDFPLIFGVPNLFPPLGGKGAAISAIVSLLIQMIWLFSAYLSTSNRKQYLTHIFPFNRKVFLRCIRIGLPVASSHTFEMFAWFAVMKVIAQTGLKNFTIFSIGNTLYIIFSFINEGLYRSLTTIISNHLASNNHRPIHQTLYSGLGLHGIVLLILAIPIIFIPTLIIDMFNLKAHAMQWQHDIKISFLFLWLYFAFSGIYWVHASLLGAKGRTRFIMIENSLAIWITSALPIYLLAHFNRLPSAAIWPLMCTYVFLGCIVMSIYTRRLLEKNRPHHQPSHRKA